MQKLIENLQEKTSLKQEYIRNILKLIDEGATIPFIARYRKEKTGGADDETLRNFEAILEATQKLLERKEEISRLIAQRATLSDTLKIEIEKAESMRVLEDIYRPFKLKKNTRASTAIEKGLLPLANKLSRARLTLSEFKKEAKNAENIQGAQDILAERYADNPKERRAVYNSMSRYGILEIKKAKNFTDNSLYKNFVNKSERVSYIPSHRYLALMRGVKEKELSVKITIDTEYFLNNILEYKIPRNAATSKELLFAAYKDGLKRLLLPSIEREVHKQLKEKADVSAINTFGKNLDQLLMTPPVRNRVILGVDPAFVSGCKLAVIDENGNYLDSAVVYPTKPKEDYEASKRKVLEFVKKYNITAIAIGNATASRETQEFFAQINSQLDRKLSYTVVSEAGASVYSASVLAFQEYPNLDVTIRGAISIGARLRDPMATLVKIDPKSLGIGQYQHDVDQKLLNKKLDDVTTDLVNRVGVDINSASLSLLSHVAGIGMSIAKNIISYRDKNGIFTTKEQLLKVKGLGQKAYLQAVGFIRIKDGENEFDDSGIHPESYALASQLKAEREQQTDLLTQTEKDIIKELEKPGFDPREELPAIPFKEDITDIKMLKEGSFVSGVVRNITDFGAFVDIGLKNDGMIHISKVSEKRVSHPLEVLSLNQYLPRIEVVSIDKERGKVGLSLKES